MVPHSETDRQTDRPTYRYSIHRQTEVSTQRLSRLADAGRTEPKLRPVTRLRDVFATHYCASIILDHLADSRSDGVTKRLFAPNSRLTKSTNRKRREGSAMRPGRGASNASSTFFRYIFSRNLQLITSRNFDVGQGIVWLHMILSLYRVANEKKPP